MPLTMDQLMGRDQVLAIDFSGSMGAGANDGTGLSRYESAKEAALGFAYQLEQIDPDGFDLIVFNRGVQHFPNATVAKVEEVFTNIGPGGTTNMSGAIAKAKEIHAQLKQKADFAGLNLTVITDGEPNNKTQVAREIADWTTTLVPDDGVSEGADTLEVGIQFLQIGDDAKAQSYLIQLDDDLVSAGARFDIVDTKTFNYMQENGLTVKDLLLSSVND